MKKRKPRGLFRRTNQVQIMWCNEHGHKVKAIGVIIPEEGSAVGYGPDGQRIEIADHVNWVEVTISPAESEAGQSVPN